MMHSWSFCLIFLLSIFTLVFASPRSQLCRADQRDALLEFKSEFSVQIPDQMTFYTQIEMWRNNTDCCSWDGISCNPKTGKVVELNIFKSYINGPLKSKSSLFRLQNLQSLILDSNNLTGILPESIGNLKYLRFLSLDDCNLFGKIPSSLGNLSYLTHLVLGNNYFSGELPYSIANINQLKELDLGSNKLNGRFPPMLLNLSKLTRIDLASNHFEGTLPSNMSSLYSKLVSFVVRGNSFSGSIPSSIFVIPSLIYLNMERNNFSGPLEIGNISSPYKLEDLSLRENNLNGSIPGSISKLVSLRFLDLSFSHLGSGMVDLSLFSNLISLLELDLSGHNLMIRSTFHLSSPIESLILSSCNIVEFPKFLKTQTTLSILDISVNQIEGQVPEWLWRLPNLEHVNISHNFLSRFEGLSDAIQRSEIYALDISLNTFQDFPLLPKSTGLFLGSENRFSGHIPRTICELVSLTVLVLSNNNFSGSIPLCFKNFRTSLSVLHLRNNSLSGIFLEESISDQLISVDVGRNQLSGELPKSLINCTQLELLNVEDNKINDKFPFWLRLLPNLQVLVLRSNEFHGPLSSPGVSVSFHSLRIFDISENCFSGVLSSDYFDGWTTMSSDKNAVSIDAVLAQYYHKTVDLTNKGLRMELIGSGFIIYKTIDVSGNRFEGDIPKSIGFLKELIVLNMSNNAFTGCIPPSLTNLTNLQSLDLSQNKLSGQIPPDLGKMTFLARMNFSYNKLEGPIPRGTQIQSQDSSSFVENPELCGVPLQKLCGREKQETKQEEDEDEDEDEEKEEEEEVVSWTAAGIGYVPGVLCGLAIGHILNSYKHDWFLRIFHSST